MRRLYSVNVGTQDSGELSLQDSPLGDRDTSVKSAVRAHSVSSATLERANDMFRWECRADAFSGKIASSPYA